MPRAVDWSLLQPVFDKCARQGLDLQLHWHEVSDQWSVSFDTPYGDRPWHSRWMDFTTLMGAAERFLDSQPTVGGRHGD